MRYWGIFDENGNIQRDGLATAIYPLKSDAQRNTFFEGETVHEVRIVKVRKEKKCLK